MRQLSFIDQWIQQADQALRVVTNTVTAERDNPAREIAAAPLSLQEKKTVAGLMRVNHAGEIAAQALYQGQAFTASNTSLQQHLQQSANEEVDHLAWCEERLQEVNSHTSRLAPLWYAGSFCIGAIAGLAGDRWSLGFVAETEYQVQQHLEKHMAKLPTQDAKSRAILEQMHEDEATHAKKALDAGAAPLPKMIKAAMTLTSKIMTKTSYWI
jgi:ubiquinone biosynthesis monooxygenase Coq7